MCIRDSINAEYMGAYSSLILWTPLNKQAIFAKQMFNLAKNSLENAIQKSGSDSNFEGLIHYVIKFAQQDKEALLILYDYVMNNQLFLKNALKWNIVLAIASSSSFSNEEKQNIFLKVKNEDSSDYASKIEKQFNIILINDECQLDQIFNQKFLILESTISKYTQIAEMQGFVKNTYLINSSDETKIKFANLYFNNLQTIFTNKNASLELQLSYMKELFPNYIGKIDFMFLQIKEQIQLCQENQISLKRFLIEKEDLFRQKQNAFKTQEIN
eukprot:TRINITY_DN1628_c0_g1_i1.p2 TRINITY_DN1628_c0_g1~~TRINITY_DN1628_c0_g1_i1.p2  ORF type:complete len:271 (-),score=56.40 TRINITY_DN1628_c0_g1_i1:148-960(-)